MAAVSKEREKGSQMIASRSCCRLKPQHWVLVLGLCSSAAHAEEVVLQAKSYIRKVDLFDPKQFDPGAKGCEAAMAAIVNCGTIGGEDPKQGTQASGEYRLFSEVKADIQCSGNKVAKWTISPAIIDAGKEFGFLSTTAELRPGLAASPGSSGAAAADKVTLHYRMRGQPNEAGNVLLNQVKPRTCTYIWHAIDATLTCKDGKPQATASMNASGFPSHRLWVNGKLVKDAPQGPFDNLWNCDVDEPSIIK